MSKPRGWKSESAGRFSSVICWMEEEEREPSARRVKTKSAPRGVGSRRGPMTVFQLFRLGSQLATTLRSRRSLLSERTSQNRMSSQESSRPWASWIVLHEPFLLSEAEK